MIPSAFVVCNHCEAIVARFHVEHITGRICPCCGYTIDLATARAAVRKTETETPKGTESKNA